MISFHKFCHPLLPKVEDMDNQCNPLRSAVQVNFHLSIPKTARFTRQSQLMK